jgi:hypothetical protein
MTTSEKLPTNIRVRKKVTSGELTDINSRLVVIQLTD